MWAVAKVAENPDPTHSESSAVDLPIWYHGKQITFNQPLDKGLSSSTNCSLPMCFSDQDVAVNKL